MQSNAAFDAVIHGMDGAVVNARTILHSKLGPLVTQNLSAQAKSKAALALSSFGMYFSPAAGGAVRIQITIDSMIYYITDHRANGKNGLVVMDTPEHPPLASSFGRWQQSLASMPLSDDAAFVRTLLGTMVR